MGFKDGYAILGSGGDEFIRRPKDKPNVVIVGASVEIARAVIEFSEANGFETLFINPLEVLDTPEQTIERLSSLGTVCKAKPLIEKVNLNTTNRTMAYEGLENNKNAEKWTLEDAESFLLMLLSYLKTQQENMILLVRSLEI